MLSGDLQTSPCLWFHTKQEIVSGGFYAPNSLSIADSMVKADGSSGSVLVQYQEVNGNI